MSRVSPRVMVVEDEEAFIEALQVLSLIHI